MKRRDRGDGFRFAAFVSRGPAHRRGSPTSSGADRRGWQGFLIIRQYTGGQGDSAARSICPGLSGIPHSGGWAGVVLRGKEAGCQPGIHAIPFPPSLKRLGGGVSLQRSSANPFFPSEPGLALRATYGTAFLPLLILPNTPRSFASVISALVLGEPSHPSSIRLYIYEKGGLPLERRRGEKKVKPGRPWCRRLELAHV